MLPPAWAPCSGRAQRPNNVGAVGACDAPTGYGRRTSLRPASALEYGFSASATREVDFVECLASTVEAQVQDLLKHPKASLSKLRHALQREGDVH